MATRTAIGAVIVVSLIGLSFYMGRKSKDKEDLARAASRAAAIRAEPGAPPAVVMKPKPPTEMINPEGIALVTVYRRDCPKGGQCGDRTRTRATVEVSDPGGVFDKPKVAAEGAPHELRLPWGKFKLQAIDDQGHKSPLTEVELIGGKTITADLVIEVR